MLSPIEREQYLIGHIPYRLQLLRLCHYLCSRRLMPDPIWGLELPIGVALMLDRNDSLDNPILESGLIYCRVLLEFLGIKLKTRTGQLSEIKGKKNGDDVFITDFDLKPISVAQATGTFLCASPPVVAAALVNVIENANKTVAHLTSGPNPPATYPCLKLACLVVTNLVHRHVYLALGEEPLVLPIDDHETTIPPRKPS